MHGVNHKLMHLFYQALLESFIRYGIQAWYGSLSVQPKNRPARLVAIKVIRRKEHQSLQFIYEQSLLREVQKILANSFYFLHAQYELLPAGR